MVVDVDVDMDVEDAGSDEIPLLEGSLRAREWPPMCEEERLFNPGPITIATELPGERILDPMSPARVISPSPTRGARGNLQPPFSASTP
jgi:hypothetical protein